MVAQAVDLGAHLEVELVEPVVADASVVAGEHRVPGGRRLGETGGENAFTS